MSAAIIRSAPLLAAVLAFPASSPAAGGSRCHGTARVRHRADAIWICESLQANDSTCHFVCGVLG